MGDFLFCIAAAICLLILNFRWRLPIISTMSRKKLKKYKKEVNYIDRFLIQNIDEWVDNTYLMSRIFNSHIRMVDLYSLLIKLYLYMAGAFIILAFIPGNFLLRFYCKVVVVIFIITWDLAWYLDRKYDDGNSKKKKKNRKRK